jgi:GalNAc-alpha-(1->4)-GalNAc-alpha-(1->3)-diNAcBac-PP-undecaprenol alpha-1,4-N-acetyl-D-galactosaminyltransferase
MRITLVISSLSSGGAERVMSSMANYWAEHCHDVTFITLTTKSDDFYSLLPKVRRIALGLTGKSSHILDAVWNNVCRLWHLRQSIRASRADVVISFIDQTNVLTLAGCLGLQVPVVVSERIDPRFHNIGVVWAWLRQLLYPQAAAVVVQTDAVRIWAEGMVRSQLVHIIPNAVTCLLGRPGSEIVEKSTGGVVAAMGRLSFQKGFDVLLKAFAQCSRKHDGWSLIIVGEGEERQQLEAKIFELGIQDRVSLPGRVQDAFGGILSRTDIFVMSSRFEGFPNALLEAMAYGCAVISTDCPSGPRDIIREGVDGVLVPPNDVGAMAEAMERLMMDQVGRQVLGRRATEIVDRFSMGAVMGKWDEVLAGVIRGSAVIHSHVSRACDEKV